MQLIRALIASGILLGATSSALAERWVVTEGQRGEWTGRWHLHASTGEFRMHLRQGAQELSADGFYIRSGNIVSIARTRSSDGNDCHYMGTITGNAVTGTSFCSSGGPNRWSAVITED